MPARVPSIAARAPAMPRQYTNTGSNCRAMALPIYDAGERIGSGSCWTFINKQRRTNPGRTDLNVYEIENYAMPNSCPN
jgi:hypothetical protein